MKFTLGQFAISRIEELTLPSVTPEEFFIGLPAEAPEHYRSLLGPEGLEAISGRMIMSVHSWLVRTDRHIILIDTCMGNHKSRPGMEPAHQLNTPYLQRLAACGVHADQVDFVLCTHLHVDHVGWNTRLIDGRWVPTFPNARYIISKREFEHWDPQQEAANGWGQDGVFEDSVLPCLEAGQVALVDDGYILDDGFRVEAAPGHTVGNVSLRATSAGKTGIFSGDAFHSPLQIAFPDVCTMVCEDPAQAIKSRLAILDDCAAHGHLLMPAHFPPPYVGRVQGRAHSYVFHPGL